MATIPTSDLLSITHKILARGLRKLRPRLVMAQRAAVDFQPDAAEFGDVINVPLPTNGNPRTVNPGPVPPTPDTKTITTTPIPVDQWYHDDFFLTDAELVQVNSDEHFVPMALEACLDGLATQINQSIWGLHTRFFNSVGDDGAAPFDTAGDANTIAAQAHRILNEWKVPRANRNMTISFLNEQDVITNTDFRQFDTAGPAGQNVVVDGIIGRKIGFDWLSDDDVPQHTVGDAASRLVNSSALAVGDKTVPVDGGTGTFNQGDLITFAGHSQQYSVQATLAGAGNLTIEPGLQAVPADNAAISYVAAAAADHYRNLAWERGAIQLVSRIRKMRGEVAGLGSGRIQSIVRDPVSGLAFRLQVIPEYMQTAWDIDVLWGVGSPQPERGVIVIGNQ